MFQLLPFYLCAVVEVMVQRVKKLLTAAQDWEQQVRTALKQK